MAKFFGCGRRGLLFVEEKKSSGAFFCYGGLRVFHGIGERDGCIGVFRERDECIGIFEEEEDFWNGEMGMGQ